MRRNDQFVLNPTLQIAATAEVSRRHRGRRVIEVTEPRTVKYLLSVVTGRMGRVDAALRRELVEAGILVRRSEIPREVVLDPRLGPRASGRSRATALDALQVSRGVTLRAGPYPPPGIVDKLREPFLPATEILWVRTQESGISLPYTFDRGTANRLTPILRGRRPAGRIPQGLVAALCEIGALVERSSAGARRAAWRSTLQEWRQQLLDDRFALIRDLFPGVFLAAVRRYYNRLDNEGYLLEGDRRDRGAPLLYDEPVLEFLGRQLAPLVRQVTGDRAPYTFSYLRIYDRGAALGSHLDKPVCRWNVDLVVGGNPAPERRTAWPLWIDGAAGRRAIRLGLGDAILYQGTKTRHWRRAQVESRSTVLASFHFGR